MKADSQEVNLKATKPVTLAEQRLLATPGDADQWFDSDSQSDALMSESDQDTPLDINQSPEEKELKKQTNEKSLLPQLGLLDDKSQTIFNEKQHTKREVEHLSQITFQTYPHNIDKKFAILLRKMMKAKLIKLSQIANLKYDRDVQLDVKRSKIFVRAPSKQEGSAAIENISNYVDDLNLIRLDVRPDTSKKIQSFSLVKNELKNKGIIVFGFQNQKSGRETYIGGLKKPQQLRNLQSQIKQYHIFNYSLKKLYSKRSYKLIMSQIFKSKLMRRELMKFNKVNMIDVDYKQREGPLRYFLNTLSKIDCGPVQYEDLIMKQLPNFFVITYVLQSNKEYYQKLQIVGRPQIIFKIVKQWKKQNLYYLMIITQRQIFFQMSEAIQNQISKVGNFIVGVRFFNYFEPSFRNFNFNNEVFLICKFPKNGAYSMNVSAKTREGHIFKWNQVFQMFLKQRERNITNKQIRLNQKQTE